MTSFSRLMLLALAFVFVSPAAQAVDTMPRITVEEIVKDYLINNPEVIIESLEAYQIDEEKRQKQNALSVLDKNYEALTASTAPMAGNPDGDVTVIEFFDYNCGYCKKALPDVRALVAGDKNVRIVFQELPVLGQSSVEAAKWSLAAQKQGKYFEYHQALMDHRGAKNKDAFIKLAKDVGLDEVQLEKDSASKDIEATITQTQIIARKLGISGTPGFIVGKTIYRGYLGDGGLVDVVTLERDKK